MCALTSSAMSCLFKPTVSPLLILIVHQIQTTSSGLVFWNFSWESWLSLTKNKLLNTGNPPLTTKNLLLAWMWCLCKDLQAFIQAILLSDRRHKKLNLLIEFSNSISLKFYFKANWHWTCIQNKLAYSVFSLRFLF